MIQLSLAPMEGVVDWVMRDILTSLGGIDHCVTEFLRVTHYLHADEIFFKFCPELKTQGRTRAGSIVFFQLLGGDAEWLAINAAKAAELGAPGIDLNFGCPAKTVNRHDGGACLLQYPDRIFNIVSSVRAAVPGHIPVTAKIRLGFNDKTLFLENAQAAESAGAHFLTVHARTKTDGYKPPAYWEYITQIKEKLKIPVIANGEIWNVQDFLRCQEVTGSDRFMIGRGAMSNPFIFQEIRRTLEQKQATENRLTEMQRILPEFFKASALFRNERYAVDRTKQWLRQLSLRNPEFTKNFEALKTIHCAQEFQSQMNLQFA